MKAKDFCLKNQDRKEICLKDLTKKSKFVLVYFYPKDNTPGCTIEANDFTSLKNEFAKLNCNIIGISPDSEESHCDFIKKQNLGIELLSNQDKSVLKSYGAYGKKKLYGKEYEGVIRSTFLISKNEIIKSWKNVKAKDHAKNVLKFIKELKD